jgi:hypothetical protein
MSNFPMPFTCRLELKGGDLAARSSFVVTSMFTPSHRDLATRLATSLEQLGLPFAIYEVPTVHRSISSGGTDEPGYTKANFISYVLREFQTPVLYVDCDCVFRVEPKRIRALVTDGCDFAIYNWLADEHTDAFDLFEMPAAGSGPGAVPSRLYRFRHAIDWYAPDQLICSGAVQFYSNSAAALALLAAWSVTIQEFPGALDDHCLDRAFNIHRPMAREGRWAWLDKAYARYLFWIYVRPVIDHPQMPAMGSPEVADILGPTRWNQTWAETRTDCRLFSRDAIIDADRGLILRPRNPVGTNNRIEFVPFEPLRHELFLP